MGSQPQSTGRGSQQQSVRSGSQRSSGSETQEQTTGSRSHRLSRSQDCRSSSSGGWVKVGCFSCFGSARILDVIDNEPNEKGLYYDVSNDRCGPQLDTRGNNVDTQLHQLAISTYKNSFIDLAKQKPKNFDHIMGVLYSQFPNPPSYRFFDAWAKSRITRILNNKRSCIRWAAREAMATNNKHPMLPGGVH